MVTPGRTGRPVGVAGEVEQAAVADAEPVEARALRVRAVLAEGRDADHHQSRVELGGAEAPAFQRAGSEVLADDVAAAGQPLQEVAAGGLAQVEGHAAAAPSLDRPEQRVAVDERADLPHEVAGAGLLDLDDVGALLAEEPGAERRRDAGAQVEHPQTLERPAHFDAGAAAGAGSRGRPSTRSPMIVRWISFVPAKIEAAW